MISTVIAKPTKNCNAECSYCSAPPDGAPKWSFDDFKLYFDKLADHLSSQAYIIWHGGEPMLQTPEFYEKCWEYARSAMPAIRFSMQSNMLGYETKRWFPVFNNIMKGSLSTSYDPDQQHRLYKGSSDLYARLFFDKLDLLLEDGFRPMVIGTYTDDTIYLAEHMYEMSKAKGDKCFPLRVNYRYPAGRECGRGELISPRNYGEMLVTLYNRWIKDVPGFAITPLDQMFLKVVGGETNRCPWTKSCGGSFVGLETNGDIYNCADFADLEDPQYKFGNLKESTIPELFATRAARQIRKRRIDLPVDCKSCRHFGDCEGGCARDAVLYKHGMGGKFHYCESWMMVFDRIKESIHTGEADGLLAWYGYQPERVRRGYQVA
jgi:radical SAM protein with 4Fe4S-binding SPASM domain